MPEKFLKKGEKKPPQKTKTKKRQKTPPADTLQPRALEKMSKKTNTE